VRRPPHPARWLPLWGGLALAACTDQPQLDYDHFRDRTAGRRDVDAGAAVAGSRQDLTGRWLLHALLQGGIDLGLIVTLEPQGELAEGEVPSVYAARIWYWKQDVPLRACDTATPCDSGRLCNDFGTCESPPLVVTTATVTEDGTFDLVADPLDLPADVLRTADPVQARVIMHAVIADADQWCGAAEGSVVSPLTLNLAGSSFAAFRHRPQEWVCQVPVEGADPRACTGDTELENFKNYEALYKALPFRCAPRPGEPDPVPDMGVAPDGGPQRPESPDLSGVASAPRDITGNWIFQAKVNGVIPLQLWLSMFYTAGPDGTANLDGALRSVMAEPGTPALATFTTVVDADGRFEVWLPGLTVVTDLATVQADILLAGATLPEALCGFAAGQVNQPPLGALTAATTFYAAPWDPNTDPPMGLPSACPAE